MQCYIMQCVYVYVCAESLLAALSVLVPCVYVAKMQPYTPMQDTRACEMHGWYGWYEDGGALVLTEARLPVLHAY